MSTVSATNPPAKAGRRPAHGTCRLTLTINGVPYAVRPIDAPEDFGWSLRKADGAIYNVALQDFGRRSGYTCDCPDFILRRDGRDPSGCKHIKALIAVGLLDAAAEGGAR